MSRSLDLLRNGARWGWVAWALVACQEQEKAEPKPQAPEMKALEAAFQTPTGTVNKEVVAGALDVLLRDGQTLQRLAFQDRMAEALDGVGQAWNERERRTSAEVSGPPGLTPQAAGPGRTVEAFGVRGTGWIEVSRLCNGWGAAPTPDPANGALRLNAGFSEKGFDPVVWGSTEKCRYLASIAGKSYRVEIDGSQPGSQLSVYLGETLKFTGFDVGVLLISLRARVSIDDAGADLALDFRVDPKTDVIEFLVPVPDGKLVASFSDETNFSVRAANGTFTCDLAQKRCKTQGGQEIPF